MSISRSFPSPKKIAIIGSYTPRQCGIATFTSDLRAALNQAYPNREHFVVAVTDSGQRYDYPPEVRFEIRQQEIADYEACAEFLNREKIDLVCVQHEYGIYGGPAGRHLLRLLSKLNVPVVATLHTILEHPNEDQFCVMGTIADVCESVVVMSRHGADILQRQYDICPHKIEFIHHGVPEPRPSPSVNLAESLSLEGKQIILTFGLLSPDKGIEVAIDAMPAILNACPDAHYLVVGATHPHVRSHSGEAYRESLMERAIGLGVQDHISFHNRFVSLDELVDFLSIADLYITPYHNMQQITSGTLAYALGSGCAIISTPYWYAQELLAEDRGVIVPRQCASAISDEAISLLVNEDKRMAMRKRALRYSDGMSWPSVATRYGTLFQIAAGISSPISDSRREFRIRGDWPPLSLDHVRRLTDDTGIIQHALYDVPNRSEGYCTDDNARAMILALEVRRLYPSAAVDGMINVYLSFLAHALNRENGRFRNFMSYDRQWLEGAGSEDCHGRALWALGTAVKHLGHAGGGKLAKQLFQESHGACLAFTSPRAWAYAIFGHDQLGLDCHRELAQVLCERLYDLLLRTRSPSWNWFEDSLTYCNARLPQALILAGQWDNRPEIVQAGLDSLEWLTFIQSDLGGRIEPVGSSRAFRRGETKPRFDQQPVEVASTVSAYLTAWRVTKDPVWMRRAEAGFEWFVGDNFLGLPLTDLKTGGCFDGLHPDRVNQNQGAESTLSLQMARTELLLSEQPAISPPGLRSLEAK